LGWIGRWACPISSSVVIDVLVVVVVVVVPVVVVVVVRVEVLKWKEMLG
jgi:hypothetical protein